MKSRLAEVSQLFGLGPLLHKRTAEVSGGEKQRIALAGLLALYPHVLLLDEPTSQLDPVHAEEVLQSLRRLHEEWGFTIVMS
ncbi:energy-coupling factor ABC transporter ATP-binding protein, partial [Frankia sp. Cpl3]|nr:energy-coupling factor ABC transporter ATP-binding protein [Frankia sp. Cpl3]